MPEKVYFSDSSVTFEAADQLFAEIADKIIAVLPRADIEHVGSTAVPGCLTKGDLDILVRVAQEEFEHADRTLANMFDRNDGSDRTETFSAFLDSTTSPDLGVQLAIRGSKYDFFIEWKNRLRSDEELLTRFNSLKADFHGKSMSDYREAKDQFILSHIQIDE